MLRSSHGGPLGKASPPVGAETPSPAKARTYLAIASSYERSGHWEAVEVQHLALAIGFVVQAFDAQADIAVGLIVCPCRPAGPMTRCQQSQHAAAAILHLRCIPWRRSVFPNDRHQTA